ncbi:MAG: substrate-binding domain-containing protein [Oscillospiraceae bacterium]|jgi:phosphate transport system substrate-binding protein|nr:substrate-binding domain-containing protein [Oscillospiraceae bacterium]
MKKERQGLLPKTSLPRWKTLLLILCAVVSAAHLVFALLFGAVVVQTLTDDNLSLIAGSEENRNRYRKQSKNALPDKLWISNNNPNINQSLGRDKNWRQIVQNSAFRLGALEPDSAYSYYAHPVIQTGGTYPVIDGSTVMIPLAIECVRQHWGIRNDTNERNVVQFSTTHDAYVKLFQRETGNCFWFVPLERENEVVYDTDSMSGPHFSEFDQAAYYVNPGRAVDLFLGTAPSPAELALAAQNGVTPVIRPVCWDALVLITHKNNPVESLTQDQVIGIFSGRIRNWKEVGGPDQAIQAYQREPDSGSQTGMEELVMRGVPMADPQTVLVIEGMAGLVERVAEYQNGRASLGYSYRYYVDRLYKNDSIKVLRIDGTAPDDEAIRSGRYPYGVRYVGVIRQGEENQPGGLFLDWLLSAEGQACIRQAGYLPLQ